MPFVNSGAVSQADLLQRRMRKSRESSKTGLSSSQRVNSTDYLSPMSDNHSLPSSGPLPRPVSSEQARETLRVEAFPAPDVQLVRLSAVEFTAICPRTGQPDFGSVEIEYVPAEKCLESKALKYYLWSVRDEGALCESLAARIADDVVYAIEPHSVKVDVVQNIRGGIGIVASATRTK